MIVLLNSILGITCAASILKSQLIYASVFLMLKNIFDAVDGQLARMTNKTTRMGRFLDSISDFVVNFFIFLSMFVLLVQQDKLVSQSLFVSIVALIGLTFRVSYFVYYQVRYLHILNSYKLNKQIESLNQIDYKQDHRLYFVQKIYILIYGWQDNIIHSFDSYLKEKYKLHSVEENEYYSNASLLRFGSFLGLGTETTILAIFLYASRIEEYLIANIIILNLYLILVICLRINFLSRKKDAV